MADGLIFDLDGTLVDSLPGIAASLNHALGTCGFPVHPVDRIRGFIGNGSLELARRSLPAGEAVENAHRVEAGFKSHYARTWHAGTRPYAGIHDLLETFRRSGRRLAVLSNKPHDFTVEIVRRLFPEAGFDEIRGQREAVPRKPDPTAALGIASGWTLAPGRCAFIGDSTVDLETAKRAGMTFLGVAWGYHDAPDLAAAGAGKIAKVPAELPDLLESR